MQTAAKIVYLDQNIWIELARAEHGRKKDEALSEALRQAREAAINERAVFPLSAMHYMETWESGNPKARERLGTTMLEISRGVTVASYRMVLIHELRSVLKQIFPSISQTSLAYLGRGVAHAFGSEIRPFQLDEALRSSLSKPLIDGLEAAFQVHQERAALTGISPLLPEMGRFGPTKHGSRFRDHLNDLARDLSSVPDSHRETALYGLSLGDIIEPLTTVLVEGGHQVADLLTLGVDRVRSFVDSLQSRRVDIHLHKQVLKNPNLRARLSDLEDWAGLGPATAYCDLVICEKHFASLLRRDGFQTRATILTDVRALPDWLSRNAAA